MGILQKTEWRAETLSFSTELELMEIGMLGCAADHNGNSKNITF